MSRFNQTTVGTKTVNLAGGAAYSENPKTELISLLATSFGDDKFYRKAESGYERLKELLSLNDPLFAAKALVYARQELGMRTVTHVGAGELSLLISGKDWAKRFYKAVVKRPDDMAEIVAYLRFKNYKMPKALQKGLAAAFDKFDRYQLAKYKGDGKEVNLVDLVNMLHPKPTERNKEALFDLINGRLSSTGTFESELSKAGQVATSEEEKVELKSAAWASLIGEKKIGYLALLRNLCNIMDQSPESLNAALEMLVDERLIRKSLVMPFQFLTAFEEIMKQGFTPLGRSILEAIDKAATISCGNLPKFNGDTLIVLDVSGSMKQAMVKNTNRTPAQIGSVFACALASATNGDLMVFDNYAQYVSYVPGMPILLMANQIPFNGGGTNFSSIFATANRKYERVIVLSDMQGYTTSIFSGNGNLTGKEYASYKKTYNANPKIFSFDLAGYGQLMAPESNVFCIAGFSDKTIQMIAQLDKDKDALVKAVEAVVF